MGLLRILLAVSVLLSHSAPIFGFRLVGARIAVQSFYIISGFYMSLILNEKYIGQNSSYKLFITNRLYRLYPIYWLVLFLTISFLTGRYLFSDELASSSLSLYFEYFNQVDIGNMFFLFFTNILIFFQDFVIFLGLDTANGDFFFTTNFNITAPVLASFIFVPQAWTIGIEIAFYLIAPFIVRRTLKTIIPLILASLALRFLLYSNGLDHDPWTYRFFPTEMVFFLFGNVSYVIYKRIRVLKIPQLPLNLIYAFILGYTIFLSWIPFPLSYRMFFYYVCFVIFLPFVFYRTRKWKFDRYIGELSYPIYISHVFIMLVINSLGITMVGGIGISLTIVTIVFSIIVNETIAKRIERIRQNRVVNNNS
jgi:peptidoglycan/LPS O-acetylase OafA/YrhL